MTKRVIGWLLALIGFASLIGPFFLAFAWFTEAPVQVRGGLFTIVVGTLATVLLFWGSTSLLRASHEDRRPYHAAR